MCVSTRVLERIMFAQVGRGNLKMLVAVDGSGG